MSLIEEILRLFFCCVMHEVREYDELKRDPVVINIPEGPEVSETPKEAEHADSVAINIPEDSEVSETPKDAEHADSVAINIPEDSEVSETPKEAEHADSVAINIFDTNSALNESSSTEKYSLDDFDEELYDEAEATEYEIV